MNLKFKTLVLQGARSSDIVYVHVAEHLSFIKGTPGFCQEFFNLPKICPGRTLLCSLHSDCTWLGSSTDLSSVLLSKFPGHCLAQCFPQA